MSTIRSEIEKAIAAKATEVQAQTEKEEALLLKSRQVLISLRELLLEFEEYGVKIDDIIDWPLFPAYGFHMVFPSTDKDYPPFYVVYGPLDKFYRVFREIAATDPGVKQKSKQDVISYLIRENYEVLERIQNDKSLIEKLGV